MIKHFKSKLVKISENIWYVSLVFCIYFWSWTWTKIKLKKQSCRWEKNKFCEAGPTPCLDNQFVKKVGCQDKSKIWKEIINIEKLWTVKLVITVEIIIITRMSDEYEHFFSTTLWLIELCDTHWKFWENE